MIQPRFIRGNRGRVWLRERIKTLVKGKKIKRGLHRADEDISEGGKDQEGSS